MAMEIPQKVALAGEESNLSLAVLLQGSIRVVSSKCLVCHIRTIMSR
jgi:hypothetical protein